MSDAKSGVKWESVRLGDVCEIMMGQSPPGSSYNSNGIGEPLLNGPTEFGDIFPSPVQWTTEPYRFAEPGDILFCVRGATTGRKNKADRRYCIGRGLAAIRAKPERASIEFLYHALDYVTSELIKEAAGSTFPNLPGAKLRNFELLLPPLDEQRRIVAIIDEQMTAVEEARAAAESQLQAAEELTAAYLREVFEGEGAQGWPVSTVGALLVEIRYGYTASADFSVSEPRFLRITDIQNGQVDWSSVPGCQISATDEERQLLRSGDIVIARTGGTVGKSYLISSPPRAVCASYLIRLRPDSNVVAPAFLYAFLQSDRYWNAIGANARGAGQPNVNARMLSDIELPVPPLEQQELIMRKLTELLSDVELIRTALHERLKLINTVPPAILRQAFSGEL